MRAAVVKLSSLGPWRNLLAGHYLGTVERAEQAVEAAERQVKAATTKLENAKAHLEAEKSRAAELEASGQVIPIRSER